MNTHTPDIQQWVALAIVLIAMLDIGRRLLIAYRQRNADGCAGCGQCGKTVRNESTHRAAPQPTPLVTLSVRRKGVEN